MPKLLICILYPEYESETSKLYISFFTISFKDKNKVTLKNE